MRQIIEKKIVILTKVLGKENASHIFTKAVLVSRLKHCLKILQMIPSQIWSRIGAICECVGSRKEYPEEANQIKWVENLLWSLVLD